MAVYLDFKFQKPGVVFANGNEASKDGLPDSQAALVQESINKHVWMIQLGVMIGDQYQQSGVTHLWDQATCTLTVRKMITDTERYYEIYGPLIEPMRQVREANGWAFIGSSETPV